MVKKNYAKPNKITLARWVDKTLDLTLRRISCQGSKVQGSSHLTLGLWMQKLT